MNNALVMLIIFLIRFRGKFTIYTPIEHLYIFLKLILFLNSIYFYLEILSYFYTKSTYEWLYIYTTVSRFCIEIRNLKK